jgi:hypothetical protein
VRPHDQNSEEERVVSPAPHSTDPHNGGDRTDRTGDSTDDRAGAGRTRPWYLATVWPLLGGLVVLGALAYVAIPGVRSQAEASLTRQETPFVELYAVSLDDASHVGTTCQPGKKEGTTRVVFAMRSHLHEAEDLAYEVSVHQPADAAPDTASSNTGTAIGDPIAASVPVAAGATATEALNVPVPAREAFDVQVRMPSTGQFLLLHCAGFAALAAPVEPVTPSATPAAPTTPTGPTTPQQGAQSAPAAPSPAQGQSRGRGR